MAGRPSLYSVELADRICEQLAMGKSLTSICKADDMPQACTVFSWLRTKEDFAKQYARAKEESADALLEETFDIADNGSNDWMETNDPDNPGYRFNNEHYQRSRMRVDVRKWAMAKLKPKKYGDKVVQEITGADGGPVQTAATITFVGVESDGRR